jgi:hypothetical protein
MNEKITELVLKAGWKNAYSDPKDGFEPVFVNEDHNLACIEKLAELMIAEFSDIVKETAILVAQTAYSDGEDAVAVQKRVAGALSVLEVLRKRFGVK